MSTISPNLRLAEPHIDRFNSLKARPCDKMLIARVDTFKQRRELGEHSLGEDRQNISFRKIIR